MMSIVQFLESSPTQKDNLLSLRESFSKSPQILSLTGFALKQRVVSEDDYLSWAQKTYLLPSLKVDFFHLNNPNEELWQKWKDFYLWRPDFVPVAEWDGVLVIACLEKPSDWTHSVPVCFVLSHLAVLESWYQRYVQGQVSEQSISRPAIPVAPPPVSVSMPTPPPPAKNSFEPLELQDEPAEEEVSLESIEEPLEALEGLEDFIKGGAKAPAEAAFDSGSVPQTASSIRLEKTNAAPVVSIPTPKTAPPPPPPAPQGPAARITVPSGKTSHHVLVEMLKNGASVASQIRSVCDPIKGRFQKYMILSVSESGDEVIPVLWTEEFYTQHAPGTYRFPIPGPCIFKIVSATHKPFHGYISLNDTNEKFFEEWTQGQIPDHATIIPLLMKDKLIGMVMALGEKSSYSLATLKFTEKVVQDLSKKMNLTPAKAA